MSFSAHIYITLEKRKTDGYSRIRVRHPALFLLKHRVLQHGLGCEAPRFTVSSLVPSSNNGILSRLWYDTPSGGSIDESKTSVSNSNDLHVQGCYNGTARCFIKTVLDLLLLACLPLSMSFEFVVIVVLTLSVSFWQQLQGYVDTCLYSRTYNVRKNPDQR